MDSNKPPGTSIDGLPVEFYKTSWTDLVPLLQLISALNCSCNMGTLSITQRRGIIKLIPKKDAEPQFIKNWRPLTLLNCDYKIAAKAIANWIKTVLPKLINNDQTGFLKGRLIGENIRLTDSIIKHASGGRAVFWTYEEVLGKAVLFLHVFLYHQRRSWPKPSGLTRMSFILNCTKESLSATA